MELDISNQITSDILQKEHFDVLIAVSGYESRSVYLTAKLDISGINKKIVFGFNENKNILFRQYNDNQYLDWGFTNYNVSAYDSSPLKDILDNNCLHQPKHLLNILIDYSCLPKVWYREIINYFINLEEKLVKVKLWFSYSPSEYSRFQTNAGKNIISENLPVLKSDKDIALIIGLGDDNKIAENLLQYLKSKVTYVYYADSSADERFVRDIVENNQNLISQVKKDNIIKYPIHDLNSINKSLTDLCLNFRLDYQLVLAPVGPKPFNLMCYILANRYPDIKIWEMKTKGTFTPYDKKAQGELLVYQLEFTTEEVEYAD